MFIGVYLCGSGLVFLIAFLALSAAADVDDTVGRLRQHFTKFGLTAAGSSLLGLILFIGLSVATGLLTLGQSGDYSIPGDYIELGVRGWLILLIGALGILSPALTAVWMRNNRR